MINSILKYFPDLNALQRRQMEMLFPLYAEWNSKINVISRKDMDNLLVHHVLHSLAIAEVVQFCPATRVLDVGTGGGFPGIPLAIMFPRVSFCLVDSIGKKIKVVKEISEVLGLNNVTAFQTRAEDIREKYDFVVSRAVTNLPEFYAWTRKNIGKDSKNKIPNGILYLKGGDIQEELKEINARYKLFPVDSFYTEEYFRNKYVVHIIFG
jgi:16S rRNA (guanine527-N7)-methyltransferase